LCSQFLRDYIELPYFKEIRPEDIEDVSDQFVPLFAEERNADRVKKVHIKQGTPFFLISLIEHKSTVDYNVSMQIFRYMVYIWETYAKEAEKLQKGVTKRADFQYPPILPIVYYEGAGKWTVPLDFKSKIVEGDVFGKYIPDFEYYLVPLRQYTNEDLLAKKDEISLVMLINRMQNAEDVEAFRKLPGQEVDEILRDTPEHLVDTIGNILRAFLMKLNLPLEETEELVGKVKEKKMGYLFEHMEKMDIQEERRKTAEARAELAEAKEQVAEVQEQMAEAQKQSKEQLAQKTEQSIKLQIETCQELGAAWDIALQKIQEKNNLSEAVALEKMKLYWKE